LNISAEGVTLIHGRSGKGKSSILEAIAFVINGKGRNIVKAGKKSCSVTLRLVDGACITRSKRPNILTVQIPGGDKLEDDAAQGYVDQRFTSTFDIVAYLRQSGKGASFVTLSPRDKLVFLEELAFHGYDITRLKSTAHEIHRENNQNLVTASAKLEVLTHQLDELPEVEVVKCPIKVSKDSKIEPYQEKLEKKIRKSVCKKEAMSVQIDTKLKKLELIIAKETKLASYAESLTESERELALLEEKTTTNRREEIESLRETIETVSSHASLNKKRVRLDQLGSELTKMKKEELEIMRTQLWGLQSSLWDQGNEKDAASEITDREEDLRLIRCRREIKKKIESIPNLEKFRDQKQELDEMEESYVILSEKTKAAVDASLVRQCPVCEADLRLCRSKLVRLEEATVLSKNEILRDEKAAADMLAELRFKRKKVAKLEAQKDTRSDLQKQLEGLRKIEEDPGDLQVERDEWKSYIQDNNRAQAEIKRLGRRISSQNLSETYTRLNKEHESLKRTIDALEAELDDYTETSRDLDELREELLRFTREQQEFELHESSKARLAKRMSSFQDKMNDISLPESSEEIREQLDEIRGKGRDLTVKMQKIEALIVKLRKYVSFKNDKSCALSLNKQLNEIANDEAVYQTFTRSAEKLRGKIKEAESKCLESFVWSLQSSVQLYLDEFFPHDPITISISRFKTTKTKKQTKPEIHITFSYKGQEFDYQSLSGGELQRVVLAFTLALVEKFNAPFVMLDESTSNLDQELTNLIVHTIRKYHSSRPVILVAHQVVTGVFENMIEI
jgi:DNA repair exonuclease SbcCD ATPase subunit